MTKREVYNGYEEKFLTGSEIKELFSNAYECFGKHHSQISSHKIDVMKFFRNLENGVPYRVFLNKNFCIILDNVTDAKLYFFGYTIQKPAWAKD